MKANLPAALRAIGVAEKRFSNHPKDPGGPTMKGVTKRVYEVELGRPCTIDELKAIPDSVVASIFTKNYADKVAFDRMPSGLDLVLFDTAVNSGPSRAVKLLQTALGFTGRDVDGDMGSLTINAVLQASPEGGLISLIGDFDANRLEFMQSLKTWVDFGVGWTRRVASMEALAYSMADSSTGLDVRPIEPSQGKATGAVKVTSTHSGMAAIGTAIIATAAGASQLSAALTPFGDLPGVRYALIALAIVAAGATVVVASRRAADGATT